MKFRDIATSHLREDPRIQQPMAAARKVFSNFMYEVFVCVYSGSPQSKSLRDDLVTCLVQFKEEDLRLMYRLDSTEIRGNKAAYVEELVKRVASEGKSPYHLIRDAKMWCQIPFTLKDRAAMRMANIDLPRPPKGSQAQP